MPEQPWIITTVVGTGEKGYAGDGGPAARALLNGPFDVGFDAHGNLYFSDTFNHCIRRVEARTGVITTCAGCGEAGYSGDGGLATRARFNEPYGIAVDNAGNIYVADRHNHCVRRVDGSSGIVTTFAGNGPSGFGGDDGPASRAGMVEPNGLAFDPAQTRLFIADVADHRVRVVDLASGVIWTFAGTGEPEHSGDGGPAISRRHLRRPRRQSRGRRDRLHPRAAGQHLTRRRPAQRDHHDGSRDRGSGPMAATAGRLSPRLRCSKGAGDRPRGQSFDRRYRKPRDPPDRPAHPNSGDDRRQWPARRRR